MNDKTNSKNSSADLNALFNKARASQPPLDDRAFTGRVMASLSRTKSKSLAALPINQAGRSFNWMDALGLGLGLIACFSFVEPVQLIAWVGNTVVPNKLVLSPLSLLLAGLTMGTLAFSGWWALEGERQI